MDTVQSLGEMSLADLFEQFPTTIPVFCKHRMACVGCDLNAFETVAGALAVYRIDREVFLAELAQSLALLNLAQQPLDATREDE